MRMTLFADASLCSRTGAAGWGSWAIRDDWGRGKFQGGPIKSHLKIKASNNAEIAGIALALWYHWKAGDLVGVNSILIQCDNVTALGYICQKIRRTTVSVAKVNRHHPRIKATGFNDELTIAALQTIADTLKEIPNVAVRHVKGHSGAGDGRSWVNERCDSEARRHMQARRKELDKVEGTFKRYLAEEMKTRNA